MRQILGKDFGTDTRASPRARRDLATGAAAVIVAPGRIELTDRPRRAPADGEIEIRLEGCGVCGSNLPVWEGRSWFEYPLPPGNPGHEGWGRVVRAGRRVGTSREGQRVAFLSSQAFSEFETVPAEHAFPLPPALDDNPFPGEALACAINVMRRAGVRSGQRVAVVGVGFLGALLTQLAAREGADVLATSRRSCALDIASAMGAHHVLRFEGEDLADRARELCGQEGCDVVIEATGAQAGLDVASELVRERGRLVIAGYHQDGSRSVDMQSWNWRGIDVVNAHERDPRIYLSGLREAVHAVAEGRLEIGRLFTHAFPLARLGDALDMACARPRGFMKALVIH